MSFFDKVLSFFSVKGPDKLQRAKRLYIVDAGSGNSRLHPREQVQMLQQLSRFAEKEQIAVQAVFEGRPLREVGHGEEFRGVTVFFADQAVDVPDLVIQAAQTGLRKSEVMVITPNSELERKITSLGAATMRPSTFRKAMENGGGGGDRGPGGGGGGDRRSISRRRRRPRSMRERQPQDRDQTQERDQTQPPAQPTDDTPREEPKETRKDGVSDLIDLV